MKTQKNQIGTLLCLIGDFPRTNFGYGFRMLLRGFVPGHIHGNIDKLRFWTDTPLTKAEIKTVKALNQGRPVNVKRDTMPGGSRNERWVQYVQVSAPTQDVLEYTNQIRYPENLLITNVEFGIDIWCDHPHTAEEIACIFHAASYKKSARRDKFVFIGKNGDEMLYIGKRRGISTLAAYERKSKFSDVDCYHIELRQKSRSLRREGVNLMDDVLAYDIKSALNKKISIEVVDRSKLIELGQQLVPAESPRFSGQEGKFQYDKYRSAGNCFVRNVTTREGYVDTEKLKAKIKDWGLKEVPGLIVKLPIVDFFAMVA